MTKAAEGKTEDIGIAFTVGEKLTTVKFKNAVYEVTPDSNVTVYTDGGVLTRPADPRVAAEATDPSVRISPGFNAFAAYGVRVKMTEDGPVVSTGGDVRVRPVPPRVKTAPDVGDKTDSGWTYLGEVKGKPLLVAPKDAGVMRWSKAKKTCQGPARASAFG